MLNEMKKLCLFIKINSYQLIYPKIYHKRYFLAARTAASPRFSSLPSPPSPSPSPPPPLDVFFIFAFIFRATAWKA